MKEYSDKGDKDAGLVVDETTIYEIDLECYECLTETEKKKYFGEKNISRL